MTQPEAEGPGEALPVPPVADPSCTFIHSGDLIAFEAGAGEFIGFDG